MSKVRTYPHPAPVSPHELSERITVEELLGERDYRKAQESDLLDMFATGAIQHILAGTRREGFATGFHLESAARVWNDQLADHGFPMTGVVATDLGTHPAGNNRTRPYAAAVLIGGMPHTSLRRNDRNITEAMPSLNTMFPRNFTALDTLEAIRQAFYGRGRSTENLQGGRVISVGVAHSVAGEAFPISIVWDLRTEKIVTAAPVLSREEIDQARAVNVGYLATAATMGSLPAHITTVQP